MLTLDQTRRATIDDLINLPLVSFRLREKRFEEKQQFHFQHLKKKELEITKREEKLTKKEKMLFEKEKYLIAKEADLADKERKLMEMQIKIQ